MAMMVNVVLVVVVVVASSERCSRVLAVRDKHPDKRTPHPH